MLRYFLIGIMTFGLLGLVAGCGSDSTSSDDSAQSIADQFGGFTPTDEAPAFGDPALAADMADDEEFDDAILASSAVDSVIDDTETGVYVLRIVWGSLEYDSTITEPTDWTGSLTVSRGIEIVRRLIRFERGQDYIQPRTARNLIEWVSITTVHHDGIFVNIYIPPPDTASTDAVDEPVTVTFETEPFSVTFNISELIALDTIYYLEDSVNAVGFRAHKLYPAGCAKGFLEGRWGRDSTGQGVFRGRWMSRNGALLGHLKGEWGQNDDGDRVFYGKYTDITGKFEGLWRGKYKPHPNHQANYSGFRHAGGWFWGRFYDADANPLGVLRGHYLMPKWNQDERAGYFQGRWKTFCPRTAEEYDGLDG